MEELISAALKARENASAAYSKFKVGAAVLTENGKIFSGCNVESATYTITAHAEINAIANAVSNGEKTIKQLVVVSDSSPPFFPCAICRQFIIENCKDDIEVIAVNLKGETKTSTIKKLYPDAFVDF